MTVRLDDETARQLPSLLSDVIAIPLTTTARDLPTWAKLSPAGPLTGYPNADCIESRGDRRAARIAGYRSAMASKASATFHT